MELTKKNNACFGTFIYFFLLTYGYNKYTYKVAFLHANYKLHARVKRRQRC